MDHEESKKVKKAAALYEGFLKAMTPSTEYTRHMKDHVYIIQKWSHWWEVQEEVKQEVTRYGVLTMDTESDPETHEVCLLLLGTITSKALVFDFRTLVGKDREEAAERGWLGHCLINSVKDLLLGKQVYVNGQRVKDDMAKIFGKGFGEYVSTVESSRILHKYHHLGVLKTLLTTPERDNRDGIERIERTGLGQASHSVFGKGSYKPMEEKLHNEIYPSAPRPKDHAQLRSYRMYHWRNPLSRWQKWYLWHDATTPLALLLKIVVIMAKEHPAAFKDVRPQDYVRYLFRQDVDKELNMESEKYELPSCITKPTSEDRVEPIMIEKRNWPTYQELVSGAGLPEGCRPAGDESDEDWYENFNPMDEDVPTAGNWDAFLEPRRSELVEIELEKQKKASARYEWHSPDTGESEVMEVERQERVVFRRKSLAEYKIPKVKSVVKWADNRGRASETTSSSLSGGGRAASSAKHRGEKGRSIFKNARVSKARTVGFGASNRFARKADFERCYTCGSKNHVKARCTRKYPKKPCGYKHCDSDSHRIKVCPVMQWVCEICMVRGHKAAKAKCDTKSERERLDALPELLADFEAQAGKGLLTRNRFMDPVLGFFYFGPHFSGCHTMPYDSYEDMLASDPKRVWRTIRDFPAEQYGGRRSGGRKPNSAGRDSGSREPVHSRLGHRTDYRSRV